MMKSIAAIIQDFESYSPSKLLGRRYLKRACTAILLSENHTSDHGPSILLIQRALREGDPWSGHMGLPGGRVHMNDAHSFSTVKREVNEEIGINSDTGMKLIGRLSDVLTRTHEGMRPMVISPFVFYLTDTPEFKLNHEVAEIIWVPLVFLSDPNHRQQMSWRFLGKKLILPCIIYQEKRIWGLTLLMIDELIDIIKNSPARRKGRVQSLFNLLWDRS